MKKLTRRPAAPGGLFLVFKLLYRHVSFGQMAGFFLANLLGLSIVV